MSNELKPSESVFSTSMMQPEALEILAASWARALANNGGWLGYRPVPWPGILETLETDATATTTHYVWMTAGTWLITAKMGYQALGAWSGSLYVDGTTIFEDSFQNDGSEYVGTVYVATKAWVPFVSSMTNLQASPAATYRLTGYYRPYAK